MRSKLGRLNWRDFLGGLILAVIIALLEGTIQSLTVSSSLAEMDFYPMIKYSGIAFCSYLLKNLFKNSDGKYLYSEKELP